MQLTVTRMQAGPRSSPRPLLASASESSELIDETAKSTKAAASSTSTMNFQLFGKINDSRVPAVLPTP
jgi:hypothetical protein